MPVKKEKIPASVKNAVYATFIVETTISGIQMCWCCRVEPITKANHDCGHIIPESKGGKINLDNLRPICGNCNSTMGTKNMKKFISDARFWDVQSHTRWPEEEIMSKYFHPNPEHLLLPIPSLTPNANHKYFFKPEEESPTETLPPEKTIKELRQSLLNAEKKILKLTKTLETSQKKLIAVQAEAKQAKQRQKNTKDSLKLVQTTMQQLKNALTDVSKKINK